MSPGRAAWIRFAGTVLCLSEACKLYAYHSGCPPASGWKAALYSDDENLALEALLDAKLLIAAGQQIQALHVSGQVRHGDHEKARFAVSAGKLTWTVLPVLATNK